MSSPEERARAEYRENVRRGVAMDRPRLFFFLGVMEGILVLLVLVGCFQDRFPDFLSPATAKSSAAPVD